MNKVRPNLCLITLLLFCILSCKKKVDSLQSELNKLPAITQNGTHSFGFLLNGTAWTPRGFMGYISNYVINADPTFQGGSLAIKVYRVAGDITESFGILSDRCDHAGTYTISDTSHTRMTIFRGNGDLTKVYCQVSWNLPYNRRGTLVISRYDMTNGIISGTFEFSLVCKECMLGDTIKITNGRFDYKL
ncbi:MAG: hypothetical protein JWN76_412 [Chitinophagaceae bacterium]|nr:hypothetical protein [Chitinophagaceae bacterium]